MLKEYVKEKILDSKDGTMCEGQYGEWLRVNLLRGDKKGENTESSSRKIVDHRMGLRSNEGLSEGDKVKGEGDRETDQELEKEIQGMGVRDIVQKIGWKGDYSKKNKEWWVREGKKKVKIGKKI